MDKLHFLPSSMVALKGGMLARRQAVNDTVTVPILLQKCRETGRVDALRHQWNGAPDTRPHPFWDSDLGKCIESASYTLMRRHDEKLEADIDEIVELMAQAQDEDGYLNSYYQTCEPKENRWTNLYYMHELYCMGHLIEGAAAYHAATGKTRFLEIMCRYADLACQVFAADGEKSGAYCGHPEIELALVRLYQATGRERYLRLSSQFIRARGQEPYYFETESLARGVDTRKTANQKRHLKDYLPAKGPYAEYQAHIPASQQFEPVGHAVRDMYLLSGMADIAAYEEDGELHAACMRVWNAMVATQMAITGGIGPSSDGERFTFAYDIPNEYTYNESCATAALIMAGRRILAAEADSRIADVMEQALYNTLLASVSADGKRFFYANYLSVFPERFNQSSKAVIDKMRAERQEWFDVACCPPNVSRLIGSVAEYMAATRGNDLYLHLYAGAEISAGEWRLQVQTEYPWEEDIRVSLKGRPDGGTLWLRIPGWCQEYLLTVDGKALEALPVKGYLPIVPGEAGEREVLLRLLMKPTFMQASVRVREDCGRLALMRGPVVYCLEEMDNGPALNDIAVSPETPVFQRVGDLAIAPQAVTLEFQAIRYHAECPESGSLYSPACAKQQLITARAVPYFLWGNRGFGEMLVWINRR